MSFTCANCSKVCKNKGGLTNHLKKCRPVENKQVEAESVENKQVETQATNNETKQREEKIQPNTEPEETYDRTLEYKCITNRYALKDKIHELHNYMRNNGVGYGMNALKVFNIFYALKKIEDNGLCEKFKLDNKFKFSELLKLANNKSEILAKLIIGDLLDYLAQEEFRDFLFYEIPRKIKSSVLAEIIKSIENISIIEKSCNVLLSGKIYEYFIGRDADSIKELGSYFTDRHIVDFILEKVQPKLDENGNLYSMIDMFGGSGGFTIAYTDYMIKNNPNINWSTEINKIHHYDMNEDVIKSAALEVLCLTKCKPCFKDDDDKNGLKARFTYKNSFTDEFDNEKFHYILTNPPYGGDTPGKSEREIRILALQKYINNELKTITDPIIKNKRLLQLKKLKQEEAQIKKIKESYKVKKENCSERIKNYCIKHKIENANDKESCSLILLMDMVEIGGTVAGVLKDGVFFDGKYKDLRRNLINNFNVKEIISIPNNQFENTSVSTSIIIFDNTEQKTSEVRFSELIIEKYQEDEFIIDEHGFIELKGNQNDIKEDEVYDKLISTATKEKILKNNKCSLNGRDYNSKQILCGEGYKLVKLGNICNIINKKNQLNKNMYNYVQIGDIHKNQLINYTSYNPLDIPNKSSNQAKYKNILISTVRPSSDKILFIDDTIKNIDNFVFSSALANIELKDINISFYVYCMLIILSKNFEKELCSGSLYPRFNPNVLQNIKIPLPNEEKIKYWTEKIKYVYDNKQTNNDHFKNESENADTLFKQYIKELSDEAIIGEIVADEEPDTNIEQSDEKTENDDTESIQSKSSSKSRKPRTKKTKITTNTTPILRKLKSASSS